MCLSAVFSSSSHTAPGHPHAPWASAIWGWGGTEQLAWPKQAAQMGCPLRFGGFLLCPGLASLGGLE